jgi:pimeloyl-ACP methyl ester carboxylesterase
VTLELVVIDVRPGAAMESQSGLQLMRPRIYGAMERPAPSESGRARAACLIMHPTSNFMGHYLLAPLAERGIAAVGLNTRYVGNDTVLLMERAIQDVGAGVAWLRSQGFDKVVLIGNSGGGALMAFYQAHAEDLAIADTPAGDPIDIKREDLPKADGLVLAAAHLGRSRLMDMWNDPSVIDERDPLAADPALDIFNPANGPPFKPDFLGRFRAAQKERNARIERRVRARLGYLRGLPNGPRDEGFIIYRTLAEPRCLDPALDANDRPPGMTIWGDPRTLNYGVNSMGRYTSLTAYLSQWSQSSRADGPKNLARTKLPVLLLEHTADASVFPSDNEAWAEAARHRVTRHKIKGGTHYLAGQPQLVTEVADRIAAWVAKL